MSKTALNAWCLSSEMLTAVAMTAAGAHVLELRPKTRRPRGGPMSPLPPTWSDLLRLSSAVVHDVSGCESCQRQ